MTAFRIDELELWTEVVNASDHDKFSRHGPLFLLQLFLLRRLHLPVILKSFCLDYRRGSNRIGKLASLNYLLLLLLVALHSILMFLLIYLFVVHSHAPCVIMQAKPNLVSIARASHRAIELGLVA